jgi:serine protease Do
MRTKLFQGLTVLAIFLLGSFATFIVIEYLPDDKIINEVKITESDTIKSSVDKVYDAVVYIESYEYGDPIGSGTGFIYKKDDKYGYLITNHHVIDGADEVKIITTAGAETTAKILESDEYADIAVLSIDAQYADKVVEIGSSDDANVGDTIFTVGSPLGLEYMGTVTKGIISGKNRTVSVELTNGDYMVEVLQIDAALNPGNSGGPLLNINGQVIGVNSLKLVKSEIEGMGFALPIEVVMGFVDRLEKGQKISRPLIGVELTDVSDAYTLYRKGILVDGDIKNGVVISGVSKTSPGDQAGLKIGDVIIEINSNATNDIAHFRYNLYKYSIGDIITIKYIRDGKTLETKVTLDESL